VDRIVASKPLLHIASTVGCNAGKLLLTG